MTCISRLFLKLKNIISKQLFHDATLLIRYLIQHLTLSFSDEGCIFSVHKYKYKAALENITDSSATGLSEKMKIRCTIGEPLYKKVGAVLKNITIEKYTYSQCHSKRTSND